MPSVVRELRVFVASPGGCDDERERLRRVAENVTQALGQEHGIRINVVGWEQLPPDLGRPQAQINPFVDTCDVFVGIVGLRWGSPTGTHPSGFQEEWERVVERRGDDDHPHIALYFRTVPREMEADPGPQLTAVLEFQKRIQDEHRALYKTYENPDDLANKLWELFTHLAARLLIAAAPEMAEGTSAGAAAISTESTSASDLDLELDGALRQIVGTMETITKVARGVQADEAPDTDRLLLLALSINNDGGYVPVHVVNRLYLRRAELELAAGEERLWQRTLIADAGRSPERAGRVIPGHAVVRVTESVLVESLSSTDGDVQPGVFRILQRAAWRPDSLWDERDEGRANVVARWVQALQTPAIADIAAEYVHAVAEASDLSLLDGILEIQQVPPIFEVRELLAGNPGPIARSVATSYAPVSWKIAAVAAAMPALADEDVALIALGMSLPDDLILAALAELESRQLHDPRMLQATITRRPVADAVFAALEEPSSWITPDIAAAIVAGVDRNTFRRTELDARFTAATVPTPNLLSQLGQPGINLSAWDALSWKRDPTLVPRARIVFDTDGEDLVAPLLQQEDWGQEPQLVPYVRANVRFAALRMLTTVPDVPDEDRARVRAEAAKDGLFAAQATEMLAPIATPDDVDVLIAGLSKVFGAAREAVLDAVLAVGGTETARRLLQTSTEPEDAARAVVVLAEDADVPNAELEDLLYSQHAHVRIAVLDVLVKRLSSDELRTLLNEYPTRKESYFYNVVAELDWLLHSGVARTTAT